MTGPFSISGDDEERTLRDYVEWFALGLAYNAVNGEKNEALQNVIMCHLSAENADRDIFIEKMKKVACGANIDVAVAGKSWDLKNPSECPF